MRINRLASGRYQVRWRDSAGEQRARNFRTKEQAQVFLRGLDRDEGPAPKGKPLGELIVEYQQSPTWAALDYPTQITYRRTIERWFDLIAGTAIGELDPARVSKWIADMKANANRYGKAAKRQSFTKELNVLKSVLAWYRGYKDDPNFVSPLRARHEEETWLDGKTRQATDENFKEQVDDEIPLTEEEYLRFREELFDHKFGPLMVILADVQFDHSLRVSEAAAVMWTDIRPANPEWTAGEIKWQRHIQWVHQARGKHPDRLAPGLKNRKSVKRRSQRFKRRAPLSKTNPFFPRSSMGLRRLFLQAADKAGHVFINPETGTWFTYRTIQNAYDRAFKRAGLPYSGTHIVRYGGVNHFMDEYGADEETAMEHLGNSSEGRYILQRPRRVAAAVKSKEPSASNVHSALGDTGNLHETSELAESGGMDGVQTAVLRFPLKTAL